MMGSAEMNLAMDAFLSAMSVARAQPRLRVTTHSDETMDYIVEHVPNVLVTRNRRGGIIAIYTPPVGRERATLVFNHRLLVALGQTASADLLNRAAEAIVEAIIESAQKRPPVHDHRETVFPWKTTDEQNTPPHLTPRFDG